MTSRSRRATVSLIVLLAACAPRSFRQPAPTGWPSVARYLDSIVASGAAPGAVLGVSYRGHHYFHGTGRLGEDDPTVPDSATLYDLASLTKVVALTTLAVEAVETGRLSLDSTVVHYLPAFALGRTPDSLAASPPNRGAVTIRHLLTHSSGLPAWRPLYQETASRVEAFALADTTPLAAAPGAVFVYSDIGAILLTQIIEQLEASRLDTLFADRVAAPLGLTDTRYLPPVSELPRIAPTENDPWRGRVLRGEVHDENASRLDGVSGHAGLFSSARDLVRFADWLLATEREEASAAPGGAGATDGNGSLHLPIAPGLLRYFTTRQELPPGSSRALGWDTPSGESSGGKYLAQASFGHTGFTGTSIWIDPSRELAIVLLSNRVHPSRTNQRWGPVRALVANRVVEVLAPESVTH